MKAKKLHTRKLAEFLDSLTLSHSHDVSTALEKRETSTGNSFESTGFIHRKVLCVLMPIHLYTRKVSVGNIFFFSEADVKL